MTDNEDALTTALRASVGDMDTRMAATYERTHKTVRMRMLRPGGLRPAFLFGLLGVAIAGLALAYLSAHDPASVIHVPILTAPAVEQPHRATESVIHDRTQPDGSTRLDIEVEPLHEADERIRATMDRAEALILQDSIAEAVRCYMDGAEWCRLLGRDADAGIMIGKARGLAERSGNKELLERVRQLGSEAKVSRRTSPRRP